jgi:hypothetical protein
MDWWLAVVEIIVNLPVSRLVEVAVASEDLYSVELVVSVLYTESICMVEGVTNLLLHLSELYKHSSSYIPGRTICVNGRL